MDYHTFINTPKLYHYTTFDNALKIIIGKQLKFGALPNMNDYYETNKIIGCNVNAGHEVLDMLYKEILQYKQISLTLDTGNKLGFDIPAMWGHYADKNHGVCIIFDKNKLLKIFASNECYYNKVIYTKKTCRWLPTDVCKLEQIYKYINRNMKNIFYYKTIDWKYEQEFRVLKKCKYTDFIAIEDSIMGVILNGHALSNNEIDNKENLLNALNQKVLVYCDKLFSNDICLKYKNLQIYPENTNIGIAPKSLWN